MARTIVVTDEIQDLLDRVEREGWLVRDANDNVTYYQERVREAQNQVVEYQSRLQAVQVQLATAMAAAEVVETPDQTPTTAIQAGDRVQPLQLRNYMDMRLHDEISLSTRGKVVEVLGDGDIIVQWIGTSRRIQNVMRPCDLVKVDRTFAIDDRVRATKTENYDGVDFSDYLSVGDAGTVRHMYADGDMDVKFDNGQFIVMSPSGVEHIT